MSKYNIYFGPNDEFLDEMSDNVETLTLNEYITLLDLARRDSDVKKQLDKELNNYSAVVAETNSYASITDNGINSFIDMIRPITLSNCSVFLQNPPKAIVNQLMKSFPEESSVKNLSYAPVTEQLVEDFVKEFDSKIIGQKDAGKDLAPALYEASKNDNDKPTIVMLYGPSGVGKTETVKLISSLLGRKYMREQMSMYQSTDAYTYIFGGSHSDKSFARDLLNRDANVILLDEFDKANPTFYSAFYQFFDEGIFEDTNYKVTVGSPIIICTSNFSSINNIKNKLGEALFYRFDAFVKYKELTKEVIDKLIVKIVGQQYKRISDENRDLLPDENDLINEYQKYSSSFNNYRSIEKIIRNDINKRIVKEKFLI
ncbi:AAA family ATPase [Lentilactobacillus senioris]|uniref:AAA family ATPase n=1 Tax=Lentilactobacillus senioris TaxID=931534 RepID=UPI003D2D414E